VNKDFIDNFSIKNKKVEVSALSSQDKNNKLEISKINEKEGNSNQFLKI
jgi:hypothetical protein